MKSRKQLEAQQRYKKEQEERQRIKNEELRYVTHQSIMLWVTIAVIQVKPHANLIIHLHRNFQPPAGRPSFKQFPQGENISIHKWLLNSPVFVCVCVCVCVCVKKKYGAECPQIFFLYGYICTTTGWRWNVGGESNKRRKNKRPGSKRSAKSVRWNYAERTARDRQLSWHSARKVWPDGPFSNGNWKK